MPAKVRVLEYMQEKAVFEQEEQETQTSKIVSAELPKHLIPSALSSINLITYAITTKYVDGLPLYRIEKQLERCGGSISVATLASYIIKSAELFQPLINLLREYQQAGHIIAMDETEVQVPIYLLDGFSGYLQTDGYSGYNAACENLQSRGTN